jgi:hypothetical protein
MKHVHNEHLPSISFQKKAELEALKEKLGKKEYKKPNNPVVYSVNSYKSLEYGIQDNNHLNKDFSSNYRIRKDGIMQSGSVDWNKHKNPMIKEEIKKPEFVKIDYLRFNNKSELLQFKNNASQLIDSVNYNYLSINSNYEK